MEKNETYAGIKIEDANFPLPFPQQLEYSSPARGTWNIVHTGMLIPECHEIFVCAKGCLRGVVLTAAEMGEMGRYSALEIQEKYVITGHIEEFMIRGVSDIIGKLSYRPKAILLFINCQHFFLAYDQNYVYRTLREMYPDIDFADCYMIPTLRKSGMSPDKKMRIQLYSMLKGRARDDRQINLMGSNHKITESCELYDLMENAGFRVTSLNDCKTYEDYQNLAAGRLNIIYEPQAINAGQDMQRRLGIPYLYLGNVFSDSGIRENYKTLSAELEIQMDEDRHEALQKKTAQKIRETKALLGDVPIALDYTFTFRVLSLARRLLEEGFNLKRIYADGLSPEEKEDFFWIREHAPEIEIFPTSRPEMRRRQTSISDVTGAEKVLAIGQKAAYFERTAYFANMTECGGLFGWDGISKIMEMMEEAFETPKDTKDLIRRKGTGNCCILDQDPDEYDRIPSELSRISSTGVPESASLIPTYSSDEFGVCSSMYDLGGMTVMHDASGCNSTYTTHDEPRWYDTESLVYISAVSERESIIGDDEKLMRDIAASAEKLHPKFISLVGAPIPYMTGTDLRGIAKVLEKRTGIPCMGFQTNGMRDYVSGMSLALKGLAEKFTGEKYKILAGKHRKVNIIGMTPMDFHNADSFEVLKNWCEQNGMEVIASFGMGGSLEMIERAGEADENLVLSSGGIACAKLLLEKFGTPYKVGVPTAAFEGGGEHILTDRIPDGARVLIIGEYVTSRSLGDFLEKKKKTEAKVFTLTETDKSLIREGDKRLDGEDSLIRELKAAEQEGRTDVILADPFFKVICPETVKFIPVPHRAFSGRIFDHVKTGNLW